MAGPDNEQLAAMRVEYPVEKLDELEKLEKLEKDDSGDLDADWLDEGWQVLLRKWIGDAERAGVAEPNAMVLATVDGGRPATRSVLCKALDESGITFFTDGSSAKADQLATTPYASATFPWYRLGRQVHLRGPVTRADPAVAADYWVSRPRGSQLGFWASQQSQPIGSRAALLAKLAEVSARFADADPVPAPSNWVGYVIAPEVVEFWQGRENRLHNRIRVTGGHVQRLQP